MSVAPPPIETAEQFLGTKPKLGELVRPFRRCVAADPVTVDNVDLAAVELRGAFDVHLPMRKADGAGNVADGIGIARAGVYDDNLGTSRFEIN
jgi:hypothetical protein